MFRARQTSWVSSHFSLLTVPNFFLTASTCTDKSLTCCFNRKYALFSITINSITNLIYDFTIYKANKSTFQHPTKLPKSKSPVGAHCHSSKYKILRSDLKYFHTTIPLPIFAQTKTLIISIIKGNVCYLHPCSNEHSTPHQFSVILHLYTFAFLHNRLFLYVRFLPCLRKMLLQQLPSSFFAFSCSSSYTSHLFRPSNLFSIFSNFSWKLNSSGYSSVSPSLG